MTTRVVYMNELEELNNAVIDMGNLLSQNIERMIEALQTMDAGLARQLIKDDDKIDAIEYTIETNCINIIAKQTPLAKDLRKISSYMRIIADIERIADHCADISEYIIYLSKEQEIPMPENVMQMILQMKTMAIETIMSFVKEDPQMARQVILCDDVVDTYFEQIKKELALAMKHNTDRINQYVDYLMIIKYIERMADHCTNIARWIIFIHTGDLTL